MNMKMHRQILPITAVIFSLICSIIKPANAVTEFCPKIGIEGFDQELPVGHKLFRNEVQEPEKASFYVTKGYSSNTKKYLYIQSNFRLAGAEYALKVASDELTDIPTLLYFLVYQKNIAEATDEESGGFAEILPKFEIILDDRVFDADGSATVAFDPDEF